MAAVMALLTEQVRLAARTMKPKMVIEGGDSQVSKPSAEAILPGDANGIVFAARAGMPALTRIQL